MFLEDVCMCESRALDKGNFFHVLKSLFDRLNYVNGTQKNRLVEAILLNTHIIGLVG